MTTPSFTFRYFFPALIFFISSLTAGLQAQQITVQGKVMDGISNIPLPSATVYSVDDKRGTLTDEDGNFTFQLNSRPTLTIRTTYLGYDTLLTTVNTVQGKTVYKVEMEILEEGVTIKGTVITAGRHLQNVEDVPVSMLIISQEEADVQATTTIEKVLEQAPGVDIKDGQPNIRGSSGFAYGVGSRVMIMLDGLPLLSADASFAQFDMIPVDNIAQVEIMKGAASVLYGSSAMGGVINVITNDAGPEPVTSVRIRGAVYDKPANPFLDWDGTSSAYQSSMNIFHSRRIKSASITGLLDLVKDSGYRQGVDKEQFRTMFMLKFKPENVQGLSFGVNTSFKLDSSGAMLYWKGYHPDTTIRTIYPGQGLPPTMDTVLSGGGLAADPSSLRKQVNTRLTFDPFVKYLTPKGNILNYRGRMLRTWNTNSSNQSNANAVYYNDFQYSTHLTDSINWVTGFTGIFNTIRGDSLYDGKHYSLNTAAYTQLDLRHKKWNLTFGARYDFFLIDGDKTESSPVFRAGLNYNAWPGFNVRASAGQAFRSPSIAERYTSTIGGGLVVGANPDLVVEKGYSAEVAVRQGFRFGDAKKPTVFGFLDAAAFMMDYNNMIEFGLDTVTGTPPLYTPVFAAINIADTRITGVEVTTLVQVNKGKFDLNFSGGITYIEPINKNPTPDSALLDFRYDMTGQERFEMLDAWLSKERQDNPRALKYREKLTVRASATVGLGKMWLTSNFRAKSQILAYDEFLNFAIVGVDEFYKTVQTKGYEIFDFILGYNFAERSVLSFHIDNAFNEEYLIIPGFLAEQRKYSVQIKYVF
jgi:outer membrane cobalamin receptor